MVVVSSSIQEKWVLCLLSHIQLCIIIEFSHDFKFLNESWLLFRLAFLLSLVASCTGCSVAPVTACPTSSWHSRLVQLFYQVWPFRTQPARHDVTVPSLKCYNVQLPKIHVTYEKTSNKSCSELNFVRKSPRVHMSISPHSGARELKKLIWFKYNIVLKSKNTFTLELNTAKNMCHIQNKL